MSFSAWLLPCFFEGGGTSKNANADEEDEGAEKTTCRKGRKNVLCSSFQRVVSAVSTRCLQPPLSSIVCCSLFYLFQKTFLNYLDIKKK